MFSRDEEQQVRERLAGSLRYIVSQRLVPKKEGGRMLITELMGSNMRSRESMLLGEGETRRFADIIEAGSTLGWHSFEQSLCKAYEQDLITDETAMLYSVNKSLMRQRVDAINKSGKVAAEAHNLKMANAPVARAIPPKVVSAPPPIPQKPATG